MTDSATPSLSYDVVIATKDRPEVLRFSLPSILQQSVLPTKLIIVDASSDHARTVEVAESCRSDVGSEVELILISFRPWQTAQRNEGLRHVTAPIVFIPDDDSIILPEAAEHVLRIYERDVEEQIGGVGMNEIMTAPASVRSEEASVARKAGIVDRMIARFGPAKARLMTRLAEGPMHVACRELGSKHAVPAWLEADGASPALFLHGFRMTFRSSIIRACGFHEDFARGRGYDDFDISLSVLRTHLLVDANDALVYHHRVGGKRDDALESGITQLLNPCYITCRHAEPGSAARRAIMPFARRMLFDYSLRAHSRFGRERLRGIRLAKQWLPHLIDSPMGELTARYQFAFNQARSGSAPACIPQIKTAL